MKALMASVVFCTLPALAQLPDAYKKVDRLFWVVDDTASALDAWKSVGATNAPAGELRDFKIKYRRNNEQVKLRWSTVPFAGITVDFVQPSAGSSAFSDFHRRHGAGVLSIVHRMAGPEALEAETKRMESLGVPVLQSGSFPGDESSRYVLFDTEAQGKYVLGIACYQDVATAPAPVRQIGQYAFAVHHLEPVSQFWAKLGFPPMSITHPALWDLKYHDQPGNFDAKLGWQRHGSVVYEWIEPLKGPTTYTDHMKTHGEGLHHIAFNVSDIDAESAEWTRKGFPFEQGGAWGDKDQPGYGRFAYQDMHRSSGIDIELLWNYRKPAASNP